MVVNLQTERLQNIPATVQKQAAAAHKLPTTFQKQPADPIHEADRPRHLTYNLYSKERDLNIREVQLQTERLQKLPATVQKQAIKQTDDYT
jgi:hypothetical protein